MTEAKPVPGEGDLPSTSTGRPHHVWGQPGEEVIGGPPSLPVPGLDLEGMRASANSAIKQEDFEKRARDGWVNGATSFAATLARYVLALIGEVDRARVHHEEKCKDWGCKCWDRGFRAHECDHDGCVVLEAHVTARAEKAEALLAEYREKIRAYVKAKNAYARFEMEPGNYNTQHRADLSNAAYSTFAALAALLEGGTDE